MWVSQVDFEELVSRDEAERRRREEREARQRTILQQRIQEVKQEMLDLKQDIDGCLTEVEACFNLLLPRFELPDIYSSATMATSQDTAQSSSQDKAVSQDTAESSSQDKAVSQDSLTTQDTHRRRTLSSGGSFVSLSEGSGSEEEGEGEETMRQGSEGGANHSLTQGPDAGNSPSSESDSDSEVEWEEVGLSCGGGGGGVDMQEHGLAGHGFSIPVQLSSRVEVTETEDNSSILDTLRERKNQLLHHLLPALNKCLVVRVPNVSFIQRFHSPYL